MIDKPKSEDDEEDIQVDEADVDLRMGDTDLDWLEFSSKDEEKARKLKIVAHAREILAKEK